MDSSEVLANREPPVRALQQKKEAEYEYHGLNIFELVSDMYHRENMHSDVLKALFDLGTENEKVGLYLQLFIEYIYRQSKVEFDKNKFSKGLIVTREEEKRDITIKNKNEYKQSAIIIENKINGAYDTPNQIPTYYYQLKDLGFDVAAIVYLTINQGKEPDKSTWKIKNESDRADIENKLMCIRVNDGGEDDLINGWLKKCIEETEYKDECRNKLVIEQYIAMLYKLSKTIWIWTTWMISLSS